MATGGKTDRKAGTSVGKCALCSRKYRRPKALPCSHTVCEGCLQARAGSSPSVSCPACHTLVDLSPGAIGASKSGRIEKEHVYKIVVIGDIYTGKTSIIQRYANKTIGQGPEFEYRTTVSVDFTAKDLRWDDNTIIQLHLWDIPGQDRFCCLSRVHYKGADGAFVVCDASNARTLDASLKWKKDLDDKAQLLDGSPIPCVLLANKCDLTKDGLVNYPSEMDNFCKRHGFIGWYQTSAMKGVNIDKAASFLIARMMVNERAMLQRKDHMKHDTTGGVVKLDQKNPEKPQGQSKCGC